MSPEAPRALAPQDILGAQYSNTAVPKSDDAADIIAASKHCYAVPVTPAGGVPAVLSSTARLSTGPGGRPLGTECVLQLQSLWRIPTAAGS